jgi:hypothetical protein
VTSVVVWILCDFNKKIVCVQFVFLFGLVSPKSVVSGFFRALILLSQLFIFPQLWNFHSCPDLDFSGSCTRPLVKFHVSSC